MLCTCELLVNIDKVHSASPSDKQASTREAYKKWISGGRGGMTPLLFCQAKFIVVESNWSIVDIEIGVHKIGTFGLNIYPCHIQGHYQIILYWLIIFKLIVSFPFLDINAWLDNSLSKFSRKNFPSHCAIHLYLLGWSTLGKRDLILIKTI